VLEKFTEIVMRGRVARFQPDGVPVTDLRLVKPTQALQGDAEIVVLRHQCWIQLQGALQNRHRTMRVAGKRQESELAQHSRIYGVRRGNVLEQACCVLDAARLAEDVNQDPERAEVPAIVPQDVAAGLFGFVQHSGSL
jgi:hypothetical protein